MKRKIILPILICALCFSLAACGKQSNEIDRDIGNKINILATDFAAYDFSRQVGGDSVTVTLLVPPGSESHSFEPTPKDMIKLQNCDLLVRNGGESEAWLDKMLSGFDEKLPTVTMLECVEALEEETKEGMQNTHEEQSDEPEYDEHVWTSPVNAVKISRAIANKLIEIDNKNEKSYTENLNSFTWELSKLDKAFRKTVSEGREKVLVFADRFPARYFVEEYGLDYYAAFPGCADDAEPSAKTVAFLIDRVRENNIPAVLYIEFSNQKMADIVCEDTGCKKLLFHTCHNVSAEDIKNNVTYLQLMWANVESVKEALG